MKTHILNATTLLFITTATVILYPSCSDSPGNSTLEKVTPLSDTITTTTTTTSSIDGSWELVWAKYNGVVENLKKPSQFKMFKDGFFSLIAWDSVGKFSYGGYGKFELDDSTYKETFIYHNNPEYVGGSDWQEYELRGDTLYFKGFTKVIVQGKEETDFPKIEEKRVRAK